VDFVEDISLWEHHFFRDNFSFFLKIDYKFCSSELPEFIFAVSPVDSVEIDILITIVHVVFCVGELKSDVVVVGNENVVANFVGVGDIYFETSQRIKSGIQSLAKVFSFLGVVWVFNYFFLNLFVKSAVICS